jgi:hypothetical protein
LLSFIVIAFIPCIIAGIQIFFLQNSLPHPGTITSEQVIYS